jgi:sugar transferase EpsL
MRRQVDMAEMNDNGLALRKRSFIAKRILDVGIVVSSAPATLPILGAISLIIWLVLGPPVLFRHQRPGLYGRPFELLKFRTMKLTADSDDTLTAERQRLTRFGAFLRSTSLDELPQLYNVLKGDMSLVGPRPLMMEYLGKYSAEQWRRHDALPGMTGWAQVNGRNAVDWDRKFELDLWYIDHQSFWLDLKILALTLPAILLRKDIRCPGEPSMTPFQGSCRQRLLKKDDEGQRTIEHLHPS